MASTPEPSNHFQQPAGVDEYQSWFDADGRLVKEALMRQCLFEVGVNVSCRHNLWKFLFGIYPMNSTRRDQKTIDIENRANYNALHRRWEVLDMTIQIPDDEMVKSVPVYMEDSEDEEDSNSSSPPTKTSLDEQSQQTVDSCLGCKKSDPDDVSEMSKDKQKVSHPSAVECTNTCTCCGGGMHHSSHVQPSASSCSSQNNSSPGDWSTSTENTTDLCQHFDDRIAATSSFSWDEDRQSERRPKCRCNFRRKSSSDVLDEDGLALFNILEFPSKVYATRQPVDLERSYPKAKRVILRDVLRTDRNIHYFSHMRNLRKVHRILMIYAMFHPEVGYAQGMNDLLARFLVVTDSEVDSYWMFVKYMEYKQFDFLEATMMKKVALVKKLICEIDHELYTFFERSECQDYLFCHRWLLLDFKREFAFKEALRLFEVINSHYLELNSDKALVETDKVIAKEFEQDQGEIRAGRTSVNLEFTFDVFICVAILTMHSKDICKATDAASVYGTLNGLSMKIALGEALSQAQHLFYKYCKLSITRGFNVVEL